MKKVKLFSLLAVSALAAAVAVPTFAASSDRLVVAQATNGAAALQAGAQAVQAPTAQTSQNFMTMKAAMELALKEAPGVLKSISFDIADNGYLYYDAEVHYNNTEYDLKFDAVNGTLYTSKQDRIDWDEAIPAGSYITYEQAAEAALKEVAGGFVSKLELENRRYDGMVYDAQVWLGDYEYTVILDADDAKVIRTTYERESDAAYYNRYVSGSPVTETPSAPSGATSSAVSGTSSQAQSSQTAQNGSSRITMDRAREIAQGQVPGGRVTDVEFEYEHGFAVYEVEVREGYFWEHKFVIDASSGEILFTEKEFDD